MLKLLPYLAAAFLAWTSPAHATVYAFNGKVAKVYSNDRTVSGNATDHFTIHGFTSAGSCTTNDGRIAIYVADDEAGKRQWAMVLMARAMGWTLHARVDDAVKNAIGGCRLMVLEIEP